MTLSPEALAAYIGLILTIVAGIIRMEHRFTKLETLIESLEKKDEVLTKTNKDQNVRIKTLEQRVGRITIGRGTNPEAGGGG